MCVLSERQAALAKVGAKLADLDTQLREATDRMESLQEVRVLGAAGESGGSQASQPRRTAA